jgi:outer membrane protein
MKKILLAISLFTLFLGMQLSAQKYGHLNSGNLLQSLPQVKTADAQMKTFQEGLMKKGEEMAKAFEQKFQAYAAKVQNGELSQIQRKQQEETLEKERNQIMAYEEEAMEKVATKREELLKPILEKVDAAIQAVGKENGYLMIFDTSIPNVILFVRDIDDVEPLVRKKLGI